MRPIAIAHRGEPVGHRENTLAGFAAAVALGADMVEIDLCRTADGAIVIHHDPTLAREWGDPRAVSEVTLAELETLTRTAGTGGAGTDGVPTLAATLHALDVPLMVDFTGPDVVDGALREVRAAAAFDRCLFVSGDLEALAAVRAGARQARIGVTWIHDELPPPAVLDDLQAECWNPWWPLLTPERVAAVHATGRLVTAWTVDERDDILAVMAAGVDGIVSNHIALLRAELDAAAGA